MRALLGSTANLLEQAGLADAGLPDELNDAWPPSIQIVQDALDGAELVHAPDELVGDGYKSSIGLPFRLSMRRVVCTHLHRADITMRRLLRR